MELLIYKASAGSGKTFTLAVEYIKRLIINPFSYRHILAVTFTNKATTEMKERILQQLWGIWHGLDDSEAYLNAVYEKLQAAHTSFTKEEIRQRAADALKRILHDYNRFQVTTIDSFFQAVIRNLARELGIGSNLNIELDTGIVLDEAVDEMIAHLDERSESLSWILKFIDSKIEDGRSWKIKDDLKTFGKNIFNESFIEKSQHLHDKLQVKGLIPHYQQKLKELKQQATSPLETYSKQFAEILQQHGLETEALSKGKLVANYFDKLSNGNIDFDINETINSRLTDASSWAKKNKQQDFIISLASEKLMPLLRKAEEHRQKAVYVISSCNMATRYLFQLQLINAIREEVTQENHEKNRFLLADTNQLLSNLISDSDSAFIFEKMGTDISHIMIDEFQDTSRMQWDNFKPMIHEGLAQGADSLIVGDVKQSIYRWRNGDWNILNNMREQQSPYRVRIEPLASNYRSEKRIIKFNNLLFDSIKQQLNNQYKEELGEDCMPLLQAYNDVAQLSKKQMELGFVKTIFIKKDNNLDYKDKTIQALGEEVRKLQEAGIPLSQIAILLRTKKDKLGDIATYFEKELSIPVVSNEAFRLDASTAIGILIEALNYLCTPDDDIVRTSLIMDYQILVLHRENIDIHTLINKQVTETLPNAFIENLVHLQQMPLYELLEELFEIFSLRQIENQDAYLFKFYDAVSEYLKDHSSDLTTFIQFWNEKLSSQTIPSGEVDGIRIMTVHAAKGLEFHTVLVPCCDWSLTIDNALEQMVWCTPQDAPYNELDIVPVRYSGRMIQSAFKNDFLNERLQLWVDNLNILYVALTRAEKNMIILSNQASKKESIGELLKNTIPLIAPNLEASWDEEAGIFEYGELCTYQQMTKNKTHNLLAHLPVSCPIEMYSIHPNMEFRESNRSADFIAGIDEAESSRRFINRGSILHQLFSTIRTKADIEPSIQSLIAEGIIGGIISEEEIRQEIEQAFSLPEVQPWYDGSWQLFNECEIIWMTEDGIQQRRPDRVMLRNNEMIVVDFKFGKPKSSHERQVQTYIHLLSRMGYQNITGYLWYVDEKLIKKL